MQDLSSPNPYLNLIALFSIFEIINVILSEKSKVLRIRLVSSLLHQLAVSSLAKLLATTFSSFAPFGCPFGWLLIAVNSLAWECAKYWLVPLLSGIVLHFSCWVFTWTDLWRAHKNEEILQLSFIQGKKWKFNMNVKGKVCVIEYCKCQRETCKQNLVFLLR